MFLGTLELQADDCGDLRGFDLRFRLKSPLVTSSSSSLRVSDFERVARLRVVAAGVAFGIVRRTVAPYTGRGTISRRYRSSQLLLLRS